MPINKKNITEFLKTKVTRLVSSKQNISKIFKTKIVPAFGSKKFIIVASTTAGILVITSLGLGLGLGLRKNDQPTLTAEQIAINRIVNKTELSIGTPENPGPEVLTSTEFVDLVDQANHFLVEDEQFTDEDKTFFYDNLDKFDIKITYGVRETGAIEGHVIFSADRSTPGMSWVNEAQDSIYNVVWIKSSKTINLSFNSKKNIRGFEILKKSTKPITVDDIAERETRLIGTTTITGTWTIRTSDLTSFRTESEKYLFIDWRDNEWNFFKNNLDKFSIRLTLGNITAAKLAVLDTYTFDADSTTTIVQTKIVSEGTTDAITFTITWNPTTQMIQVISGDNGAVRGIEVIRRA